MRMHLRWKTGVVGLTLASLLAMPALAGTAWSWTGDDGSLSFTDRRDRIPERFRTGAERIETGPLSGYTRFTPEDAEARKEYAEQLYARLDRLRELRKTLATEELAQRVAAAQRGGSSVGGFEATVEVNGSTIRLPVSEIGGEPVIVEEVRSRPRGKLLTRHSTIVRQGDEILMIIRPNVSRQISANDFYYEKDLETGTFKAPR